MSIFLKSALRTLCDVQQIMIICHKNQKLQMIWFIKTGGYQATGEGHVGSLERLESVEKYLSFSGCDN